MADKTPKFRHELHWLRHCETTLIVNGLVGGIRFYCTWNYTRKRWISFHSKLTETITTRNLRVVETFAEQDDLGDQIGVWNHHRDRPKHRLEVIGQFRSSGVPGIHGDEDAAGPFQLDVSTLEDESLEAVRQCRHDGEDLLGDNWQHLDVDPVELIKTAPSTCLWRHRQQHNSHSQFR